MTHPRLMRLVGLALLLLGAPSMVLLLSLLWLPGELPGAKLPACFLLGAVLLVLFNDA